MNKLKCLGWTACLLAAAGSALGQMPDQGPFNLPTKTLGGKQLWSDELVCSDWRIQRNAITGHCRLLDPRDVRRAWGSFEQCHNFLQQQQTEELAPHKGRVVLLLHGLMGSRSLMRPLEQHLREHEVTAVSVSYASTRRSIDEHAESLAKVIANLGDGVRQIDFVGHSMGNIVVRRYLGGLAPDSAELARIGRFVMLAPPNQGARLAEILDGNAMFRLLVGSSGEQLGDFQQLEARLAVPTCQFGIVAGGGAQRNPLLPGDNDLMVSIEETKLPGARDFIVVDSAHRSLVKHSRTLELTLKFLQQGFFLSEQQRHPLPELPAGAGQ